MKGKKTGGRDFEPGHAKAGPGRPPVPLDLKNVKPLGSDSIQRLIAALWETPLNELKDLKDNVFAPAGRAIMASILYRAWADGDHQRINFILDRTIGKVKDVVEVTQKVELPTREEALWQLQNDYAVLPPGRVEVDEL